MRILFTVVVVSLAVLGCASRSHRMYVEPDAGMDGGRDGEIDAAVDAARMDTSYESGAYDSNVEHDAGILCDWGGLFCPAGLYCVQEFLLGLENGAGHCEVGCPDGGTADCTETPPEGSEVSSCSLTGATGCPSDRPYCCLHSGGIVGWYCVDHALVGLRAYECNPPE